MKTRMKYTLYKKSYSEFPATNYDPDSKSIEVDLPETVRPKFPKEWKVKGSNRYMLPNGTIIYFWNSGLAESFLVERTVKKTVGECCFMTHGYAPYKTYSREIKAGIYARQLAIDTAIEFDAYGG